MAIVFENRKRRHRKKVTIIAISILVIAIIISTFLLYQFMNFFYSNYKVVEEIERQDSSSSKYINYNKGIIQYSKDGAMAIDGQGNYIWNGSYNMNNPILDICEDYVVISDRGGKKIEVFDGSGHLISLEVLHPIIKAEVANQGVVAVLMDGEELNYIQLISPTGEVLVDSKTTIEKNGFPIDFSMSRDGRKLVTSYITLNNGNMQSKVTFYNFGGVGQNYIDRIVGGFDHGLTFVSKVEFINNDTVSVFGDDKFCIYKISEVPKLIYEEALQSEIKSIAYSDKYIGIVQKDIDGKGGSLLKVYNEKGESVFNKDINYNYNHVEIIKDEIIFYSDTEINIIRLNGKEKFSATFDYNIVDFYPLAQKDNYLIVDQTKLRKIVLTR